MVAPHIQFLIAEGAYAAASSEARERITDAREAKQWSTIISLYLWEFVAQMHLGNEPAAREALSAALRRGMKGGFVRSFSPPGIDIIPWFLASIPHLPVDEAKYLREVISRLASEVTFPPTASTWSVAEGNAISANAGDTHAARAVDSDIVLSRREEQVLSLMSRATSNRRIAEALFISENTVKKHISNIFAKLAVPNRTTAIRRARELGMLD